MDIKQFLTQELVNQVKEVIEDEDGNTFVLLKINQNHEDFEKTFDVI